MIILPDDKLVAAPIFGKANQGMSQALEMPQHNAHIDEDFEKEMESFMADISEILGDQEHVEEPKNNYFSKEIMTTPPFKFMPNYLMGRKVILQAVFDRKLNIDLLPNGLFERYFYRNEDYLEVLNNHLRLFPDFNIEIETIETENILTGKMVRPFKHEIIFSYSGKTKYKFDEEIIYSMGFDRIIYDIKELNTNEQQKIDILAAIEQKPEDEEPPKRRRM